ncbi:golgin subfamily B member 1-like [Leptopilina heterotoma]|uniref:golgin subfamily B member 1-like n=1 Tax=Leptopilina heterotoma TaxID=63436 RepID=UPI001CA91938|nr:golgin subfamily B member 1-like [Leptopilina heterotoma]XP_043462129.1 golgin subfamily B member 1-like [Leptopilina heterotoma]
MATSTEDLNIPEGFLVAPRVPQGLAAAVEGLTREVIRQRPEDIYVFAAHHFEKLLHLREAYGVSRSLSVDERNLQALRDMSEALRKRDAFRDERNARDYAYQSGWSLNETAKVLERHRSIFGDEGRKISTDEIRQLASEKEREHFRRHRSMEKRSSSSSKRKEEFKESSGNGKNGLKLISQIPNLPGSSVKDIKSELRKNRISSRERRNLLDKTESESLKSTGRTLERKEMESRQVEEMEQAGKRKRLDRKSKGLSMDRVKDYVVKKFSTTKSLEELQSPTYVEKVQEVIDETAPIIKERVEELKNSVNSKKIRSLESERSSFSSEKSKSKESSGRSTIEESGRRSRSEKLKSTDKSKSKENREELKMKESRIEQKSRKSMKSTSKASEVETPNDSLEDVDTLKSEVESIGSKNGLEMRLNETQTLLEGISSAFTVPVRRSSSAKDLRNRMSEASDVSLPVVRPLSSKAHSRSVSRSDSDNLVLPPISPDAPKSIKVKEDLVLPVLSRPGSSNPEKEADVTINDGVDDGNREMKILDEEKAEKENISDTSKHSANSDSGEESSNKIEETESPKDDGSTSTNNAKTNGDSLPLSPKELNNIEAEIEEVFRDSLNVTPEPSETPSRPDSLEPEVQNQVLQDSSSILKEQLLEIEEVEKNIQNLLDPNQSQKETTIRDKLQELENSERRIDDILQEAGKSESVAEKLKTLEEVEKRIDSFLDEPQSFMNEQELAIQVEEELNDGDSKTEDKKKQEDEKEDSEDKEDSTADKSEKQEKEQGNTSSSRKEEAGGIPQIPDSFVLTEGSPYEIPDTVTTVIIPDRISTPDSDILEVEVENGEVRSRMTPNTFKIEDQDEEDELEDDSNLNVFGEVIEPEPSNTVQDIDLISSTKSGFDILIPHQDLDQIKEEDDKDLDRIKEDETVFTERETELQQIIEEVVDKLEEDKEILEKVVEEVIKDEINENDDSKIEEFTDILEKVVEESIETETNENDDDKIEDVDKIEEADKIEEVDKIEEDVDKIEEVVDKIEDVSNKENLQEKIEETEKKDEIEEPVEEAQIKVEEDTDQKVEINKDKIEEVDNETVKNVVDIDEEELKVLQVMTSSLKEIQESESGEKLTEDDNKTKELLEDLSPEMQRITDSESTDETKETSITDGIQETTDIVENSLEIEESTGRSIESTNEVKETTMSDQSNMSLSLDPGIPIVPELNLDSLQDITISSFKMTDEEVEKKENEETESIFSTTEPEMSVTNGKLVEEAEEEKKEKNSLKRTEEDTVKVAEIQEDCQKILVTQLETKGDEEKVTNSFIREENEDVDVDKEKVNDSVKIDKIEDETYPDDSEIQEVIEEMVKEQVEVKEDLCVKASSYVTTGDEDEVDKDSEDQILVQKETDKESIDEQKQITEETTKDEEKEKKDVDDQEEANKIDFYEITDLTELDDEKQTSDPKVDKEVSVAQDDEENSKTVPGKDEEAEISNRKKSTEEEKLMQIVDEKISASSDAETEKTGEEKIEDEGKTIVLAGEENKTKDQTEAEEEQNVKVEEKDTSEQEEEKELKETSLTKDAEEIFTEKKKEAIIEIENEPSLEETIEPKVEEVEKETTETKTEAENESNVLKEVEATILGENEEQEEKIGTENKTIDIKIESEISQTDAAIEKDESADIVESRSASQCTTRRLNSATNASKEENLTNNDEFLDKHAEDNKSELKINEENEYSKIEETIKAEVVTNAINDDNFEEKKQYHIYVPELNESENSVSDTSSFITAATKIQAGIRGFLIRRRLQNSQGRSSTLDSVPSIQESFVVEPGTTEVLLSTIEEVTQPVKTLDGNCRQLTNRKRLRREDAIQRTTISLDNAFAEGGLQHTGEFHDCIPLPVFQFENQHHLKRKNISPKRDENEDRVREKGMEDDNEGRRGDRGEERTKSVRRQKEVREDEVKENGEETVERIENPKGSTESRNCIRNANNDLRSGKIGNSTVEDETKEAKMIGCNGFQQSAKGSQISKHRVENVSLEKEHKDTKEAEIKISKRNGGVTRSNEHTANIGRSQEKRASTERNSLGKGKQDRKIESDKESSRNTPNGESTSREIDDATNGRNNLPKRNNGIKLTEIEKPNGRSRFSLRKERETKSAREIQQRLSNQSEKNKTERRENSKKLEEREKVSTRREKINGIEKASQTIIVGQLINGEIIRPESVEKRQTKSADYAKSEGIVNELENKKLGSIMKEVLETNQENLSSESKDDVKDNENNTKDNIRELSKENCRENNDNTKETKETLDDKTDSNKQEAKSIAYEYPNVDSEQNHLKDETRYYNPKNYFCNQGIYPNGFAHPPNLENVFPNESSFNLDFNPKLGPILDILFSKEDQMLESNYLNFITSVEDNNCPQADSQSSKNVEVNREHSGSIREPLALPGSPKRIVIEDVTSLEEATMQSSIFIVDNSSLDAKDEEKKLEEFIFLEEALQEGKDQLESEMKKRTEVGNIQEQVIQEYRVEEEGDKEEETLQEGCKKITQEEEKIIPSLKEAIDVESPNNQRGKFSEIGDNCHQKDNPENIDTPFLKKTPSSQIDHEPSSISEKLISPRPEELLPNISFKKLSPNFTSDPNPPSQKDDYPNFEDSSLLPDASLSTLSFSMNIDDVLGLGSEEESCKEFRKASSLTKFSSTDLGSSRDSQNSQLCLETAQSPVTMMQMESRNDEEKSVNCDESLTSVERRESEIGKKGNKGSGERKTSKHENGNCVMNIKERKSMEMKEMASPRCNETDSSSGKSFERKKLIEK